MGFSGRFRRLSPIVGYRRFKGLLSHNRAVHFFLGQSAKVVCDFLVGNFLRFIKSFPLDEFGECGRACDGRCAAKGLEFGVYDFTGLLVDLERQLQRVSTGDAPYFAYCVGIFNFSNVFWMKKKVFDFLSIFPHEFIVHKESCVFNIKLLLE